MGYEQKEKFKYDIIQIGYIGLKATEEIAKKKRLELETRYPRHFLDSCESVTKKEVNRNLLNSSIKLEETDILVELTEGGLYTGLWNMAVELKKGFRINRYDMLVCQETIEVCEFFDMNPYREASEGAYLLYTTSSAEKIDQLKNNNIPARVIGYVTKELAKEIIRDDDIQCLDKPRKDN